MTSRRIRGAKRICRVGLICYHQSALGHIGLVLSSWTNDIMNQQELEEAAVIQDLVETLERHLANGFDRSGKPLNELRRGAMNQLLTEFKQKLLTLRAETTQQATDRCEATVGNAVAFNEKARAFLQSIRDERDARQSWPPTSE